MPDEAKLLPLEMLDSMIELAMIPREQGQKETSDMRSVRHVDECHDLYVTYIPAHDQLFSIRPCYEDHEEQYQPIQCHQCGGVNFHIALGRYCTAVRCVRCRWEECIHSG